MRQQGEESEVEGNEYTSSDQDNEEDDEDIDDEYQGFAFI